MVDVAQAADQASVDVGRDVCRRKLKGALMTRPLPIGSDELLAGYADAKGSRTIYLSTPITTGPRYLEWRRASIASGTLSRDDEQRQRAAVMSENLRRLAPLRQRLSDGFDDARVIDPTELDVPSWSQADYHRFWVEVISRFADLIVFADGWEYSTGCSYEYACALVRGLDVLDASLTPLVPARTHELLAEACSSLEAAGLDATATQLARDCAAAHLPSSLPPGDRLQLKDERLYELSARHSVAAFASFTPTGHELRYATFEMPIFGSSHDQLEAAIGELFASSGADTVNVRTFLPGYSKSTPFHYGLNSVHDAAAYVRKFAAEGYHTIVNETIDVHDGGVSGVTLGGVAEFSPDDTPRGVERAGTTSVSVEAANELLSLVYDTSIALPESPGQRYEFSVHPKRVGSRRSHLCVWEVEEISPVELKPRWEWPNRFSRLVGDKTFGLLLAHTLGFNVPATDVMSRRLPPFRFGTAVGTGEKWLRTAPYEQLPGNFLTTSTWTDAYNLLRDSDPDGKVAAVLSQEGVPAAFSGATVPQLEEQDLVEGVAGYGDRFMLGEAAASQLPAEIVSAVRKVVSQLRDKLGPVRIEWAHDGTKVWVLQLHRQVSGMSPGVLSPGAAYEWLRFDPADGLDVLRELVGNASASGLGILVTREVGITSHVGDILRKAQVPAKFDVAG